MTQRGGKKLNTLTLYLITLGCIILSVVLFALLYNGSGAKLLTVSLDVSRDAADAEPDVSPSPTPDVVDIASMLTPEPTAAPAAVYRKGRFLPYKEDGLWGYKNIYGVVVIEPRFTAANEFEDDVAFAAQNGKYGLIERNGEFIVQPEWSDVGSFSDGYAAVMKDNRWGYIDASGNIVIDYRFYDAGEFGCGRAAVRTSGAWCYIDIQGNVAVAANWREAGKFSSDVAFVTSDEYEKDRYYIIDKVGEKIVTFGSSTKGTEYSEGFAVVIGESGYYYINSSAATAFKTVYERAKAFSDGLAAVRENGKWGYINERGAYVIEPGYDDADSFFEGYAAVYDSSAGLWGYINKTGGWLIEPKFDAAYAFSGGVALVSMDNATYILNSEGKTVLLY